MNIDTENKTVDKKGIDDVIFPKECIEYLMNRQGAKSSDTNVFSIVSKAGQMYIEECLKKSIQTMNNGKFTIKDDNLRNFIKMENINNTISNDYKIFLMPNERYKKFLDEKVIK